MRTSLKSLRRTKKAYGGRDFRSKSRAHVGDLGMSGHQWRRPVCSAWAKSRGRPCKRRVVLRPDGSPHTVCANHGGLTPPYADRPISVAGKARISAASKANWVRYRELKAAGLLTWRAGRPKKPAASTSRTLRPETPEQRRAGTIRYLKARYPDRDWD
jgi:hypothetical protein